MVSTSTRANVPMVSLAPDAKSTLTSVDPIHVNTVVLVLTKSAHTVVTAHRGTLEPIASTLETDVRTTLAVMVQRARELASTFLISGACAEAGIEVPYATSRKYHVLQQKQRAIMEVHV